MAKPSSRKVVVVEYDPSWPMAFADLRARIEPALRGIALAIEHVGSTSVPGLAAKPIIDIDAVIPSPTEMPAAIDRLAALGYVHSGNLGIAGRETFESPAALPAHHLYGCLKGGSALRNHLAVRDYLRRNPAAAAAYGRLKIQLAEQFPYDIESYLAAKADFLMTIPGVVGPQSGAEYDLRPPFGEPIVNRTQRPGWHTVTPRIIVTEPEALLGFLKAIFDAQGEFRPQFPTEVKIGDSLIMVSDGGGQRDTMSAFLYVYVDDVDSTYRRALSAHAISIEPPAEMPYGDRRATVKGPWGNIWQIASYS